MSQDKIPASSFATDLLDHAILHRRLLPKGFAGLLDLEIDCYNYYIANAVERREFSQSQLGQDLWVAFLLDCWNPHSRFHRHGYFVEFGAFDGVTLSNSYLFEKVFCWQGIVAEPAPQQFAKCIQRRACHVDPRCVWGHSGTVISFNQVPGREELATAENLVVSDLHHATRSENRSVIQVQTISLNDLLDEWKAPRVIDYISIDTEGSEYEILKSFDFSRYVFRTLTIEHNFSAQRERIQRLLLGAGYERLNRSVDQFDDFYIHPELRPR